jgi:hypothetical protein
MWHVSFETFRNGIDPVDHVDHGDRPREIDILSPSFLVECYSYVTLAVTLLSASFNVVVFLFGFSFFFRMRSDGFSFYFAGLEVDLCSLNAAGQCPQPFATVVSATAVKGLWPCLWGVLQKVVTFEVFKCRATLFPTCVKKCSV